MSKKMITLNDIRQQKKDKLAEVRETGNKIRKTIHEIFMPEERQPGMGRLMQHVSMGIAIYDGVMTGLKVMRRIRRFFSRRK